MKRFRSLKRILALNLLLVVFSITIFVDFCSAGEKISTETLKQLFPHLKNARFVDKDDLFKNGVLFEGADDIETYGCSLYIEKDLNKDGQMDVAICGVYFNPKIKQEIPFLLILTKQQHGKYHKDFFKEFNHFFFICIGPESVEPQKDNVLTLGFKAHTDLGGKVFWKRNRYFFEHYIPP